jgi:hypothetical protein
LAHEARQVRGGRRRLLGWYRRLLVGSIRRWRWRSIRLRSIVSRRWIGWLLSNGALGTEDQLGCDRGIQILILVKAHIATGRPIENLEWDFRRSLSAHVELDYCVDTFKNLSLNDCISREARIQEHGCHPEALLPERSLHPLDKVLVNILHQEDLHVGHVVSVAAWDIKMISFLAAAAIRTRTSAPVRILAMSYIRVRRARTLSLARIVGTPVAVVAVRVLSSTVVAASGRWRPARAVVVSSRPSAISSVVSISDLPTSVSVSPLRRVVAVLL